MATNEVEIYKNNRTILGQSRVQTALQNPSTSREREVQRILRENPEYGELLNLLPDGERVETDFLYGWESIREVRRDGYNISMVTYTPNTIRNFRRIRIDDASHNKKRIHDLLTYMRIPASRRAQGQIGVNWD